MMPGYQTSIAALTLPIQGIAAGPPVSSTTMVCGLAAASGERKASRPRISAVPSDTTAKLAIRQETQQLGEHRAALIHEPLSDAAKLVIGASRRSNRGKANIVANR